MHGHIHRFGANRCGDRQASFIDPSRAEVCVLIADHAGGHLWVFESETPDFVLEITP